MAAARTRAVGRLHARGFALEGQVGIGGKGQWPAVCGRVAGGCEPGWSGQGRCGGRLMGWVLQTIFMQVGSI